MATDCGVRFRAVVDVVLKLAAVGVLGPGRGRQLEALVRASVFESAGS